MSWPTQGSIKKKVKKKKEECKRVIIACLLPVVICGLEKISFECGGTEALWSSSVSELFSNSSLFCISEVLCNLLLTFLRAGCAEPWGWALLASEPFVDCENWPENLVGVKWVYGFETVLLWPSWHLWIITSPIHGNGGNPDHFGNWFVIKCPSSPKWRRWLVRACWTRTGFPRINLKIFCSQEDRLFKTVL